MHMHLLFRRGNIFPLLDTELHKHALAKAHDFINFLHIF